MVGEYDPKYDSWRMTPEEGASLRLAEKSTRRQLAQARTTTKAVEAGARRVGVSGARVDVTRVGSRTNR